MALQAAVIDNQSISMSRGTKFATVGLCIMASLADGFDLQATGITAIKYRAHFGFTTTQLSTIFASNSAGLLIGALAGGWLADRIGRRPIMIASMILFGIFSLATAMLTDGSLFAIIRFFTGVGLGATVANVIALVAETGTPSGRAMRVTVLTSSNPLGGALSAGLMAWHPTLDWRMIFYIGGWWPLIIAIFMIVWLPESPAFRVRAQSHENQKGFGSAVSLRKALFGEGRALASIMLWVGFFFCVLAIYLVISWLPSLLIRQGYSVRQASLAATAFPFGGAIGTALLGLLMGATSRRPVMVIAFGGLVLSVAALAFAPHSFPIVLMASLMAGFFVIGAQFLLYGLSPTYYPSRARGSGVGTAVAFGRVGSIAGPVLAGLLLGAGRPPAQVLISILPGVVLAFIAALTLSLIPPALEE